MPDEDARCKHGMLEETCAFCTGLLYAQKPNRRLKARDKHRLALVEYLSNPQNEFAMRKDFNGILGISRTVLYKHFTPIDLLEIENEAFEIRKNLMVRQRLRTYEALADSAAGYEHDDVHIATHQGAVLMTDITKKYPPNPTSARELLDRLEGKVVQKTEIELNAETLNAILGALPDEFAGRVREALAAALSG